MGIIRLEHPIHWKYFLALEDDLVRLARFVELSERNDSTYSIEIARLFMSASAEVDVVMKQLVRKYNPSTEAESINSYFLEIFNFCPNFISFKVVIPPHGLSLTPWVDWASGKPPIWWQHNNKVKHHRHSDFDKATIKNCLNAMAALFICILHLYADNYGDGELLTLPKLFHLDEAYAAGVKMHRAGHSFCYKINF